jgi:hypothetical protein
LKEINDKRVLMKIMKNLQQNPFTDEIEALKICKIKRFDLLFRRKQKSVCARGQAELSQNQILLANEPLMLQLKMLLKLKTPTKKLKNIVAEMQLNPIKQKKNFAKKLKPFVLLINRMI